MDIEEAARQLDAIGIPTRLRILHTLVRAGDDGLPVGHLQQKMDIPASTLSHHLRVLTEADLVSQERRATSLICRANYRAMSALVGFLINECCADAPGVTDRGPGSFLASV